MDSRLLQAPLSELLATEQVFGRVPVYLEAPQEVLPEQILQELGFARLELLNKVRIGEEHSCQQQLLFDVALDAASHFLLRVLCCSDGMAQQWLLEAEEFLLARRWEQAGPHERLKALRHFVPTAQPDGASLRFTELPPKLLALRRAKLCRGVATVEPQDFLLLLRHCFRGHLQRALQVASQAVAAHGLGLLKDSVDLLRPALEPLLLELRNAERAAEAPEGVGLMLHNFEEIYRRSFPPCMQHLVSFQRNGTHLKNLGRTQLRPLLREAGLPLAEAMTWWRRELLRDIKVTQEVFDREHSYHIQHAYGRNGKRKPAYGWSCWKTLGFPMPQASEAHGCPFRALPTEQLEDLLRCFGSGPVSRTKEDSPPDVAQEQVACGLIFQERHPGSDFEAIRHPMQMARSKMEKDGEDQVDSSATQFTKLHQAPEKGPPHLATEKCSATEKS
ncbi:Probable DNA primase large subunit [Durusdinium trenchii]|uniref:Probable DNA primase large subunit n=1 Tax=Durusdinium trenchii TaxID=1381693 RepID=A0ABP0PXH2_9DINO